MAWSEGHFAVLDLTLKPLCLISRTSWSHLSKLWTVSRSDWGAVLIHTFDCDWIWVSDKLFVWSEGYCSVWRNRVGSLTWNRLLFASICEGWLDHFINWNQWITTFKRWRTGLWDTLRTCAGCASSCRGYLSHCWGISRSNWGTILIHTFHCYRACLTSELFLWLKGDGTICINGIGPLICYYQGVSSIFKGH